MTTAKLIIITVMQSYLMIYLEKVKIYDQDHGQTIADILKCDGLVEVHGSILTLRSNHYIYIYMYIYIGYT